MDGFDLLAEMTTTFSPTVTAAERDESLRLLGSLKVRTDGAVPPVRYSR
jgi:hypothetical protein